MNLKNAIKALEALGFENARIDDKDVVAFFPDDRCKQIICRDTAEGIKAWILFGPEGMVSPRHITKEHAGGFSPQYYFKSVKQAGELALSNPCF